MNDIKTIPGNFLDRKVDIRNIGLFLLFTCSFAVFMNSSLSLLLGPVMAALMVYLYISGYSEFVIALIIVANDALGTVFLGKLSFQYLLLILAIFSLLCKKFFSRSEFVFLACSLVLQMELFFVNYSNFRTVLFSMTYILAIVALPKNDRSMARFARGLAIAVGLIALHACLTGGVEFVEYEDHVEIIRKGILGVGIGDPNYSSFLLNIGLICTWCDREMKYMWKILLTVICLGALMITVSVSGLLALIGITVLFFLWGEKKRKSVNALLILILVVILLLSTYINAPEELRVAGIDNYIERITEKMIAFDEGDMSSVTTQRSALLSDYLDYIFTQPLFRFLFGGNTLNIIRSFVPHNTYVGLLLQVGMVGTLLLLWLIGFRIKKVIELPVDNIMRKQFLLWKVLALFMAFNLSIHTHSLWALWMMFLVLL